VIGLTQGGGGVAALVAATAGCTLGTVVAAIATTRVAMRDYRLKPQWSAWARILLATAAMCAVLAAIPWGSGVGRLAAEVGLGMAVYAAALAVLFPAERRLVITKLRDRLG
jgi:biotin transporter BioY